MDKDLSKCHCEQAGFCHIFDMEMGISPPNFLWCQTATKEQRERFFKSNKHNKKVVKKIKERKDFVPIMNYHDDLPKKTSDFAVCVIPANESAMDLLDVSRDSIKSYAKKCGADYIELTGNQCEEWPIGNKFRLYHVTSVYEKTVFFDCDVTVRGDAPNLFKITPDNKVSAYDEIHDWSSKDWIIAQYRLINKGFDRHADFKIPKFMINSGVLVIPKSCSMYYKQPDKPYPRIWCFDQQYLSMNLPHDKFFRLDRRWNNTFATDDFWDFAEKSYILHINGIKEEERQGQRCRIMSSFLPRSRDIKVNTVLFEGFDTHRSGWSYATSRLKEEYHSPNGIIVDDFIERSHSWQYKNYREQGLIPYKHDWVGFLHNPLVIPDWFYAEHSPKSVFERPAAMESLKRCKGLFTLSEFNAKVVGAYFKHMFDFPVFSLKLPSEIPDQKWNPEAFLDSERSILLLGYWLRKITSFCLLKTDYKKIWLRGVKEFADQCWNLEKGAIQRKPYSTLYCPQDFSTEDFLDHFGWGVYDEWGEVQEMQNLNKPFDNLEIPDHLPNDEYDKLLSSSIVFLNFYDTVANNAVVECIARNTPIVVCKHPSVVEYLGKDYPCYFETKEQAEEIIHDDDLILAAHEYLKVMSKEWLSADYFTKDFINKLGKVDI